MSQPPMEGLEGNERSVLPVESLVKAECRICHQEDLVGEMESPCSCRGTIQYAHRRCVQRWCNEKRNLFCEICSQRYQPNYTIELPHIIASPHQTIVQISRDGWTFSGTPSDVYQLQQHTVVAIAAHNSEPTNPQSATNNFINSTTCRISLFVIQLGLVCIIGLLLGIMVIAINSDMRRDDSKFYYVGIVMIVPIYILAGVTNVMRLIRDGLPVLGANVGLPNAAQGRADVGIALTDRARSGEEGGDLESAVASGEVRRQDQDQ